MGVLGGTAEVVERVAGGLDAEVSIGATVEWLVDDDVVECVEDGGGLVGAASV